MNRKYFFITLFFLLSITVAHSQSWLPVSDARTNALGNASTYCGSANSVFSNAASLSWVEHSTFILVSENKFLLKELSGAGAGFVLPMKNGAFGMNVNYNGFNNFNRTLAGISYSQKINNNISAGVKADYLQTSVAEYGNHSTLTGEFSLSIKVIKDLAIGMNVFNPFMAGGGYYADEKTPTEFSLGANYQISDGVLLLAEECKELNTPARFRGGVEYKPAKKIFVRGGISTQPFEYGFGAGFELKNISVDVASAYHAQLGYSPSVSLKYSFTKK